LVSPRHEEPRTETRESSEDENTKERETGGESREPEFCEGSSMSTVKFSRVVWFVWMAWRQCVGQDLSVVNWAN
jgi:hypothetical protein